MHPATIMDLAPIFTLEKGRGKWRHRGGSQGDKSKSVLRYW
jgi:hypothetical protein